MASGWHSTAFAVNGTISQFGFSKMFHTVALKSTDYAVWAVDCQTARKRQASSSVLVPTLSNCKYVTIVGISVNSLQPIWSDNVPSGD